MKFIFELVIMSLMFYVIPMSIIELLDMPKVEGIAEYWVTLGKIFVYGSVVSAEFALLKLVKR